jgi:PKD repeat protein
MWGLLEKPIFAFSVEFHKYTFHMRLKRITLLIALTIGFTLFQSYQNGNLAFSPLLTTTGAPGEGNCFDCHQSFPNNQGGSSIQITFDNGNNVYQPGMTYPVQVKVNNSTINKYGFQMTALDQAANKLAGKFIPVSGTDTFYLQVPGSPGVYRRYIEQSIPSSSGVWNFQWTAPAVSKGDIKFYAAGIAAQFPTGVQGDKPSSSVLTIKPAILPQSEFSVDHSVICVGGQVKFTNLSTNENTRTWYFDGGTPATSTQKNPTVQYNSPGKYNVKLVSKNSIGEDSIEKIQYIEVNPNPSVSFNSVHISCFGAGDGEIIPKVSSGTPGYTYQWNTGQNTKDLSSLSKGTYCITVTDSKGCEAVKCDTIEEPTKLQVTGSKTDIDCYGNNNGSIVLSVSGGVSGYQYKWSNSETTQIIQNLPPGNYSVTVTDANQCNTVSDYKNTEPDSFKISAIISRETSAGNDGKIFLNVSGATPGYTYLWSNGVTTKDNLNIAAGAYSVTINDANQCEREETFYVPFPVGIESHDNEVGVEIFPVPVSDNLSIVLKPLSKGQWDIQIFDLSGKQFYGQKLSLQKGQEESLNINTLLWPAGFYIVTMKAEHNRYLKKIQITH